MMIHCHPPRPPAPPKSPPPQGVLLPTILAGDRRILSGWRTTLSVNGLCGCGPWRLTGVLPGGAVQWRACAPRRVKLTIPLLVLACDPCGAAQTGTAVLEVETCLACSLSDPWCAQLVILPCVQLACAQECQGSCCFEAVFHITLDFFWVRPQPHHTGGCACPPLPLYPPPINPHRC